MKHHTENRVEPIFKRLFTFNARNIILAGMLGLLVLTGVMTWLTLSRIESIERKDLGHTLKNILLVTEESIYNWYLARKAYIETRTTSQQLRDLTKSLLMAQKTRTTLLNDPALAEIRHLIGESLLMHGYLDFFIVAPDYINIATMNDTLLGKPNPVAGKSDYLDKVFRGHFQLTHPIMTANLSSIRSDSLDEAQPTMFLCAPIKDETDAVIAISVKVNTLMAAGGLNGHTCQRLILSACQRLESFGQVPARVAHVYIEHTLLVCFQQPCRLQAVLKTALG